MFKFLLNTTLKAARRIMIFVVGITVMLIGVIMIITPGPAFLVIPAGLAILAIEFAWAKRWLATLKKHAATAIDTVRGRSNSSPTPEPPGGPQKP